MKLQQRLARLKHGAKKMTKGKKKSQYQDLLDKIFGSDSDDFVGRARSPPSELSWRRFMIPTMSSELSWAFVPCSHRYEDQTAHASRCVVAFFAHVWLNHPAYFDIFLSHAMKSESSLVFAW